MFQMVRSFIIYFFIKIFLIKKLNINFMAIKISCPLYNLVNKENSITWTKFPCFCLTTLEFTTIYKLA